MLAEEFKIHNQNSRVYVIHPRNADCVFEVVYKNRDVLNRKVGAGGERLILGKLSVIKL